MEKDERREMIFDIIRNQIKMNDPPETAKTLERLKGEGFSEFDAFQNIGLAIALELFEIMKFKKPFNLERYKRNLDRLPKEPK
jgi:hypothetical protein